MICPKCGSRAIGKIGQNQYYCWDCNIEFIPTRDGFRMYRLEPDGTSILDSLDSTAHIDALTAMQPPGTITGVAGQSVPAPGVDEIPKDKDPL